MLTGSFKIHREHVYERNNLELLRAAAIYGANGAGKSNLIKAFAFLKDAVVRGKLADASSVKHKAAQEYLSRPTSFEIEFMIRSTIYSYGFTIDHNTILEEWLNKVYPEKKDEVIFNRTVTNNQQSLQLHAIYDSTPQDKLRKELFEKEFLVTDKLFLTVAANLRENKITEISEVFTWIKEKIIIVFSNSKPALLVPNFLFEKKFHAFSNQVLCGFDTGISRIDTKTLSLEQYFGQDDKTKSQSVIDKLNSGQPIVPIRSGSEEVVAIMESGKPVIKQLFTLHKGEDGKQIEFEIREESEGTQRLLDFIPALYAMLFQGAVVLFDEIDKSIHPFLLKSLIAKVMEETRAKGQLIFNTHESNLLDLEIFRQDEIWFVEKDNSGATHLYSLSEYKPRFDLDVRKGYLNGRYGGIPFLANLVDLKWEEYATDEQTV
jgi:AAA15 family ATPase/GTPase